jgi:very-short-patch-repair endonuclease
MKQRMNRPEALRWRVFIGAEARRLGLVTPAELRTAAWTRLRYDVYADSRLERDHELACRAVALRLPPTAVIAGPSAAFLHGVEYAVDQDTDVHVIAPPAARLGPRRGVVAHCAEFGPGDREMRGDLPVTTVRRTAWDLSMWCDEVTAVTIIDGLLGRSLLRRAGLDAVLRERDGWRGARRAARVFGLTDAGAQSPQESRLRVRLMLAGLPRPVTQHPIHLGSGLVLHPDLAWPEFRVAVEYDGQWHADPDQLHRDRRRLNQLVAAGWLVLHVTARRMRTDFNGVVREVGAALAARGWQP